MSESTSTAQAEIQSLHPGDVLSYSAGSRSLEPNSFRIVESFDGRLAELMGAVPELASFCGDRTPLVMSCYPAALFGSVGEAVFLDTYMRESNFSRGLMLAASNDMPVIVISQPLVCLEFLLSHVKQGLELPSRLILGLGGYACPGSLQDAIHELLADTGTHVFVLPGYGMAEVGFCCLVGTSRDADGQVIYRPASMSIRPKIDFASNFILEIVAGDRQGLEFQTGDKARRVEDGWVILNDASRLAPAIWQELSSWTPRDWFRKTGYVARQGSQIVTQLRKDERRSRDGELAFHEFANEHGASWLEKPDWS